MKHLVYGISGLALGAAFVGVTGCSNFMGSSRDHTSPMYTAEAGSDLTQTCAYNSGPRAGQTVDYSNAPGVSAVRIGNKCADMHGSSGVAVAAQPGAQQPQRREGGGRFYTSPGEPTQGYSFFCRFNSGPAAGHTADYSSTLGARPAAIGSACSDGPNSGVAVAR